MKRVGACLSALLIAAAVRAEPLPIIDTHAHLDGMIGQFAAALDFALGDMERHGIVRSLLLPPPQPPGFRFPYDLDELRFAAARQPQRIGVVAGGGTLNPLIHGIEAAQVSAEQGQRFRSAAEEILKDGALAFGEIALHHLSSARMGERHPYESVAADHPLLLLLADIAAEKGVPIDLHLDVVPQDMPLPPGPFNAATPRELAANLPAFERLLAHNRKAAVIWAHAGADPLRTRTPAMQRELLARHPNLYMSLRIGRGGPDPSAAMTEDAQLKPEWRALLIEFPDRFVIGSDSFHPPHANLRRTPAAALAFSRALVEQLPAAVGRAVAYENAVRLYRLPPP
ncbi:MAG: amidohydrolase family protein [Rhodocyclales bacterium]|nr:amidohydrolase family protein [Rhodocyclales bacterium]